MQHELKGPNALEYIMAGHGKGTLVGKTTRYTYKFSMAREGVKDRIFVKVLFGHNNETDYQYIGFITVNNPKMSPGVSGKPTHPAYIALDWYLSALVRKSEKSDQAIFIHEGICGRCGRTLTVPESIGRGLGPECSKMSHKPQQNQV